MQTVATSIAPCVAAPAARLRRVHSPLRVTQALTIFPWTAGRKTKSLSLMSGTRSRLVQRASARSTLRVSAMMGKNEPQAAPKVEKTWPMDIAPQGVPLPPMKPVQKAPLFGFVSNAEITNSRAAMIGFFALLFVEAFTGMGFLDLIGIETEEALSGGAEDEEAAEIAETKIRLYYVRLEENSVGA